MGRPFKAPTRCLPLFAAVAVGLMLVALLAVAQVPGQVTREEALKDLANSVVEARRAAVSRLAAVGTMADVPQLVRALHDGDDDVRTFAEQSLWKVWSRSGDPEIDALYRHGVEHMVEGSRARAIATFTTIIERKPDFAEAWNKRATLYFLVGEYDKSLRDCDEVMKRNPYHFGALEGYGHIYIRLAQPELALQYFRRAFAINPNMASVARVIDELDQVVQKRREREI